MSFAVGDVVEIIGSRKTKSARRKFIGRQGVIVALGEWPHPSSLGCHTYAVLSPSELNDNERGWFITSLRKINPPDWSAPVVTDKELTA